jgi:hypothetical protein
MGQAVEDYRAVKMELLTTTSIRTLAGLSSVGAVHARGSSLALNREKERGE